MRTSLNDIALTERYLFGKLAPEESLLFQARLLTDPILRAHVAVQQKVYTLLLHFHRKKMKEEVRTIHNAHFHDPAHAEFKEQINQLFKP
ncbi:hypothetical protein [Ohtaekwangia sp.]|uniref:hypothetical protein n=1 Tax=Ohtaekwangia sp. TaxID=2066019 RepID=UPI002FDCB509